MLGAQARDFLVRKEAENFQKLQHVRVRRVEPKLIKCIRRGARFAQPNSSVLRLAEFAAVGFGDERRGQAERLGLMLASDQVDAAHYVAPLIGAAHLQRDIVLIEQMQKVVRLEQHVAKFGVADALFAVL